jgi:hypothetical protein
MVIEMHTYETIPGMRSRFLEILHSKAYSGAQRNRDESIRSL